MFHSTRTFRPHGDDEHLKDWMLEILDHSPHRLAVIGMPPVDPDDDAEIDELESAFIRAYDLAKDERPNLVVQVTTPDKVRTVDWDPGTQIVVAIHEHKWVGGHCVNGCPETREAA